MVFGQKKPLVKSGPKSREETPKEGSGRRTPSAFPQCTN